MFNDNQNLRVIADITLIFLFLLLPWWYALFFSLIFILVFPNFYEGLVFVFLYDFIFATAPPNIWAVFISLTPLTTLYFLIVEYAKKYIRWK